MNNKWQSFTADILLLIVAMVWGTSYGITKTSLLYLPVIVFLFIRFGLTSLFLLPYSYYEIVRKRQLTHKNLMIGSITGLILLCIFMLEVFGVSLTKASNAGFLISTFVIFTPFVEWLVLKKKPPNVLFLLAFLCLLGIALITGGITSAFNFGDLLILMAGLLRAFMVVLTKKLTANNPMPALFLTALQAGIVVMGLFTIITLLNIPINFPQQGEFWLALLYLVIFCTIFAFFAQNYAVKLTTPTRVSLLMGTEPLFGAIFASIWLNESITIQAWLGGLLIVGSSVYLTLSNVEQKSL